MFNLNISKNALVSPHPGQGSLNNNLKKHGIWQYINTKNIIIIKKINIYNLFFLIN